MKMVRGVLRRPRPVLLLMILGSLILHCTGFWLIDVVDGSNTTGWQGRPQVHLMQPSLETGPGRAQLYRFADLMDPSLMSLPNQRGFSRRLWARTFDLTMDSVKWDSPPSFLARPARTADRILLNQSSLADAVQQDVVKAGIVAQPDALQASTPAAPQPENRSVLRLSGELATRPLLDQPELPVLAHLGGLRPTVVRLGVGWDGRVQHALLERTSGDSGADATALEIVRRVRFAATTRLDPDRPTWGLVTLYWATVAPVPAAEAATESAP